MSERFFDPTFVVQQDQPRTLGRLKEYNNLDHESEIRFRGHDFRVWPATAEIFHSGDEVVFVQVDDVMSFLNVQREFPTRWKRPLKDWGEKFKANVAIRYFLQNNPIHRTYDRGLVTEVVNGDFLAVKRRNGGIQLLRVEYMDSPQPANAFQPGDKCLIYSAKPGRAVVIGFVDQAPRLPGALIFEPESPWVVESLSQNPDGTVTGTFSAPWMIDGHAHWLRVFIFDNMLNHREMGHCPYRISAPSTSSPGGLFEPSSLQGSLDVCARRSQFMGDFGFITSRSLIAVTLNGGTSWTFGLNYTFDLVGGVRDAIFSNSFLLAMGGNLGWPGSHFYQFGPSGNLVSSSYFWSNVVSDRACSKSGKGIHTCHNDPWNEHYVQLLPQQTTIYSGGASHRFKHIWVEGTEGPSEFISDYECLAESGSVLFEGANPLLGRDPTVLKPKAAIKLPDGSYRYLTANYDLWKRTQAGLWGHYSLPAFKDWTVRAMAIDGQGNTYYGVRKGENSRVLRFAAEQAI